MGSAVYLAACLEYLTAEILDLSGNAARDHKRTRINPRHIFLAIQNDEELKRVFKGHIPQGGAFPHIQPALLPKKKPTAEEREKKTSIEGVKKVAEKSSKKPVDKSSKKPVKKVKEAKPKSATALSPEPTEPEPEPEPESDRESAHSDDDRSVSEHSGEERDD